MLVDGSTMGKLSANISGCPYCGSGSYDLAQTCKDGKPTLKCLVCGMMWVEDKPEMAARELADARKELMTSVREYNRIATCQGRDVVYMAFRRLEGVEVVRDFNTL